MKLMCFGKRYQLHCSQPIVTVLEDLVAEANKLYRKVSLLTKKGYLTISVNHVKDGKVFLRRHEGIKEWYNMIKVIL